jgi:hypothetical protein
VLALSSDFLGPFLEKVGARRDFLILASKKLLSQRVSLDEAGFLVVVLKRVWKEKNTIAAVDSVADLMSEIMQAIFLIKSLVGEDASEVVFNLVSEESTRKGSFGVR